MCACVCVCTCVWSHLTVQSQKDDHNEEAAGPQRGEGHHGHSTRISYEGQTWTWITQGSKGFLTQMTVVSSLPECIDWFVFLHIYPMIDYHQV